MTPPTRLDDRDVGQLLAGIDDHCHREAVGRGDLLVQR